MKIEFPNDSHLPQLRRLWQEAFGDTDAYLDSFYHTAYAPDHCRCILMGGQIAAVLYWIDCQLGFQKLAYLYAVVTAPGYRGQGLCRTLMADTHALLRQQGYAGTLLVPQQESLRRMYAGMGYENAGGLNILSCKAAEAPASIRPIGPTEFASLRKGIAPHGTVLQEYAGLAFLSRQVQFYAGKDFLLAAYGEKDTLFGVELLGNPGAAPGIVKSLGFSRGTFRTPGDQIPFAMFHPLMPNAEKPAYFGFAFD